MSRRCELSGKAVQSGNRVSHANNKTKRRFLPNLQVTSLLSDALRKPIRLRLTTRGIKTVEHAGGLDAWLLKARDADLDTDTRRLKKRVKKALERKAAAAA
jgi:large subunit ribosomal protein L28